MKFLKLTLMAAGLSLALVSCQSNKPQEEEKVSSPESTCVYQLSAEPALVWTSYKTTAKAAVKGSFEKVTVVYPKKTGNSLKDALIGTQMIINTESVSSKDSIRDFNIRSYFFGTMKGGSSIKSEVKNVDGDNTSGEVVVYMGLNGVGDNVDFSYTVSDGVCTMQGSIDLEMWNALASLASLNEKCFDLHKGEDGDSKLWQTVDITIEIPVDISGC